jgi:hypothetical protein
MMTTLSTLRGILALGVKRGDNKLYSILLNICFLLVRLCQRVFNIMPRSHNSYCVSSSVSHVYYDRFQLVFVVTC